MDVVFAKAEFHQSEKRLLGVVDGMPDSCGAVKCIRRRRREPALPPVAGGGNSSTIKRSSRFRGVSKHRWTGRFEAHLWDKGSWNVTQKKKGKQVYLGAYDVEESAARAYDLAALKYWGPTTITNFPVSDYENELQIMHNMTKEEYLATLRRKSSGFSRGVSKYRGVARHHHNGRWEARIGRVFGNKYLYLGTYSTQEEAAQAYDIAAIECRGINAVTNFDLSTYFRWIRPVPNNANLFANSETELILPQNPFAADDLQLPIQQDHVCHQIQGSVSCSKSSPTALSLLLRSSIFKELVEKNSQIISEESEGSVDVTDQLVAVNDKYHGIFYEGIAAVPYSCTSNGGNLQSTGISSMASMQ